MVSPRSWIPILSSQQQTLSFVFRGPQPTLFSSLLPLLPWYCLLDWFVSIPNLYIHVYPVHVTEPLFASFLIRRLIVFEKEKHLHLRIFCQHFLSFFHRIYHLYIIIWVVIYNKHSVVTLRWLTGNGRSWRILEHSWAMHDHRITGGPKFGAWPLGEERWNQLTHVPILVRLHSMTSLLPIELVTHCNWSSSYMYYIVINRLYFFGNTQYTPRFLQYFLVSPAFQTLTEGKQHVLLSRARIYIQMLILHFLPPPPSLYIYIYLSIDSRGVILYVSLCVVCLLCLKSLAINIMWSSMLLSILLILLSSWLLFKVGLVFLRLAYIYRIGFLYYTYSFTCT